MLGLRLGAAQPFPAGSRVSEPVLCRCGLKNMYADRHCVWLHLICIHGIWPHMWSAWCHRSLRLHCRSLSSEQVVCIVSNHAAAANNHAKLVVQRRCPDLTHVESEISVRCDVPTPKVCRALQPNCTGQACNVVQMVSID